MITLPKPRDAGKTGSKSYPSRSRRRGGARCKAFAAVAAALVAYAGVAGGALAPKPVPPPIELALVIGNGDYVHAFDLRTPRNEAAAMAAALERLGFRVRRLEDAGYLDMLQGLMEFSQEAQSADAAVVFYAGHGQPVDGRNYLYPVDARPAENLGLIPLTLLMRSVAGASDLRLVVLDTYVGAPLEPAGGTIVAQAAAVGTLAVEDTEGSAHSPYTEALLRYLEEPGLELGMLLRKVREDVMRATEGRQEPVVYGLPGRSVVLGPRSGQTPVVDPDPGPASPDPAGEGLRVDWQRALQFRDCPECPEMVVVPEGSFLMGSTSGDGDERPVHEVTIGYRLAVGVYEVTLGEFARFVSATGRSMGDSCLTFEGDEWEERSGRHWRSPGFSQTDAHPVVCVSWDDAKAYVQWLSGETGEAYRLLSEAEWEYVARAGTTGPYHFGSGLSPSPANIGMNREGTAPVGSYPANAFELHDVHGNANEWVEDCWNGSYDGAPHDGSAWTSGGCGQRVLRGGSWNSIPRYLRSASRYRYSTGYRFNSSGFRVARTLTP